MKKQIYAAMAVLLGIGYASAQTVTFIGHDDKVIATYPLDQVKEIVSTPTVPEAEPTIGEAVDLGLSVKWASMNIGAESPSDYGDYFAWGETEPKATYTEENSKWWNVSYSDLEYQGVIDANGNLTPEYDAATVNWGSQWRIPTKEEIQELLDKCTWTWTTQDVHKGYRVTGPTGNSIFLPAAGIRSNDDLYNAGFYGYYWSSTANGDEEYSFYLDFDSSYQGYYNLYDRLYGQSVRPVTE